MQRPTHLAGLALRIQHIGFLQCVGIEFDDSFECGAGIIDRGDAIEVGLRQSTTAQFAAAHARLQSGNVDLREVESDVVRPRRTAIGRRRGRPGIAGSQQERKCNGQDRTHRDSPSFAGHWRPYFGRVSVLYSGIVQAGRQQDQQLQPNLGGIR